MKMRRWTRVTGGASGKLARKIQSEIDCRRLAIAAMARPLWDRDARDELLGGIEPALHGLGVAVEAMPDDRRKDRLDVLGQHLAAALHHCPGLRRAQDRHARPRGEPLREARRMARVVDELLHVIEER